MPGFFVPQLTIGDASIVISGEEFHHITHVFRKKINDEILLTNGKGLLAKAKIKDINKMESKVLISEIKEEKQSTPTIAVAFPLLKNKHDSLIVEKLTELGVKDFFPIVTKRTVRQGTKKTIEKFKKVAISAIKQCDNAFLPKIHEVSTLNKLIERTNNSGFQPVVALEIGKHDLLTRIAQNYSEKPICIIIGPEGGFDNDEIDFLLEKRVLTFTLGNHILRAETAAITAASQLLGYYLNKNPEYY